MPVALGSYIISVVVQGQWPWGTRENEQTKLAFLLEKSVEDFGAKWASSDLNKVGLHF